MFAAIAHKAIAWIRNAGSARIRNQRDRSSAANLFPQLRGLLLFIEVVIADERLLDAEVVQELQSLTRVFTGDEIGALRSASSARGLMSERLPIGVATMTSAPMQSMDATA